jgi:hypothetical protein
MSGGYFDYKQFHIEQTVEELKEILDNINSDKYDFIEDKERFTKTLKDAIEINEKAKIYIQRIDWFLSGDDGEENFYSRLNEELQELYNKK